jgi:hypothetical protein
MSEDEIVALIERLVERSTEILAMRIKRPHKIENNPEVEKLKQALLQAASDSDTLPDLVFGGTWWLVPRKAILAVIGLHDETKQINND